jgi:peptidoglycan/LPS O-acetylase OafA/YrhL
MQFGAQRSLAIDGLKALAALLIVLHHLAFYGPMADHAGVMLPWLRDWLAGNARMAVQVFLVVGGFLAARSLAPTGALAGTPLLRVMRNRFLRLALPYYVVLLLAVACNELARGWMSHPSISSPAGAGQLLAHVLLLQDVLDFESLSAGLWYVAIDLQLFLLLAVLWRLGSYADAAVKQRHPRSTIALPALFVSLLALASLLHFNRNPALEPWGVYFFGSYALGALAWWASEQARPGWWLAVIAACTAGALVVAFRERLVVALVVAVALGLTSRPALSARFSGTGIGQPVGWKRIGYGLRAAVHWLASISYAMFLVHFPLCLVVNAAFTRFAPPDPVWQLAGLVVAVAASVAAGAMFHAWVEAPLLRWLGPSRVGRLQPSGRQGKRIVPRIVDTC